MSPEAAFDLIKQALDAASPGKSASLTMGSDLVKDGIVDSLDSMNFLFELEGLTGKKLDKIDETFDDFRVTRLVEILTEA